MTIDFQDASSRNTTFEHKHLSNRSDQRRLDHGGRGRPAHTRRCEFRLVALDDERWVVRTGDFSWRGLNRKLLSTRILFALRRDVGVAQDVAKCQVRVPLEDPGHCLGREPDLRIGKDLLTWSLI